MCPSTDADAVTPTVATDYFHPQPDYPKSLKISFPSQGKEQVHQHMHECLQRVYVSQPSRPAFNLILSPFTQMFRDVT